MRHPRLGWLALSCLAFSLSATGRASPLVLPGVDSGHWTNFGIGEIGVHSALVKETLSGWFTNGITIHHEILGYLVFDLSSVPSDAVVTGATIRFANDGGLDYNSPDPTELLVLHEVETDPALVMTTIDTQPAIATIGYPIYLDLGDGTVLGTYLASPLDNNAVSEIPLDPAGVAVVQEAKGGLFAVGLRVDTLDRVEGTIEIFPAGAPVESSLFEIELELAPLCDDGIDNDGDGGVDVAGDLGCADPSDPSERGADRACDDGRDNDWDGLVDFPEDPHCASAVDRSERRRTGCGLGFELVPLLLLVGEGGRRRWRRVKRPGGSA